ncbi:NAD(P)-binding protein [Punctularia strigosozonata HHB-11173 SS5]|uniref:NAD(P)-binding protein n=1 Tax=Punctularia strigosozonata (strain HHB-11173) TaxID=741275 RepID=UPI0004418705|nr:NAD(P)-binding protein [Punctularia strigosozonata HHB-11173 SS5]EIN11596.1 NAD(P)-binding protein [Punctularia strigosozonata HHB-11173 SS5]
MWGPHSPALGLDNLWHPYIKLSTQAEEMISTVAVAGATGNIGIPIVEQLLAANFSVVVLSRSDNPSNLPAGVTVRKVDYDSVPSLTAALRGVDAVVSAVSDAALAGQTKLIDAAVAAGVRRFLPSEFGNDVQHPAVRALPLYAPKIAVEAHLKKASAESGLTYTLVSTGPFLDWGLQSGFLLGPLKERQAEIFDGGKKLFSATNVATIGRGVVAVLRHLEQTKNRTVYFHEAAVSQAKLLRIAKELTPGEEWTVTERKVSDLKAEADAKMAKGIFDAGLAVALIRYSLYGEGFDPVLKNLDNELLGVDLLSDEELRAVVKSAL